MSGAELKPDGDTPLEPWLHLVIDGDEEINCAHPAFARRRRAKDQPETEPAKKPQTKDGDSKD
jgi:hypothetical protein